MKTKYSTVFKHVMKAKDIVDPNAIHVSEATEKKLSSFVPYVDYHSNADLIGIAFDVAVANMFNANGDGVDSEGAWRIMRTVSSKPINVEHDRNLIIGHIMDGSFTDMTWKKWLYYDDIKDTKEIFNITLGGVLYKVVAKSIGEALLEIQKGVETDFEIAASWEVGFDSFFAAVGNDNLLENCEILRSEEEIAKVSKYMKCFGGKGVLPNGKKVFRLIDPEGTVVFLGAGLTKYPAAKVGPVYIREEDDSAGSEPSPAKEDKSISHFNKDDVSSLRTDDKIMNKEQIMELIKEVVASNKDSGELSESLAGATSKIADAIVESNKSYVAERNQAKEDAEKAIAIAKEKEEKVEALEKKIEETSTALAEANKKLEKIEQEAKAAELKEKFNERMTALDEKFELSDEDREILASQVSAVESDEDFEKFSKNLEVLMSSKLKEKIEEAKAEEEKKIKSALSEELKKRGIEDPLESKASKAKEGEVPNTSSAASEENVSIREKFSKAFTKETVKVSI